LSNPCLEPAAARGVARRGLPRVRTGDGATLGFESKRGGLEAVAAALTNGEIARAQIAALLLQLPDPPASTSAQSVDLQKRRLARDRIVCGLLKANAVRDAMRPRTGEPPNPGWFAPTSEAPAPKTPKANSSPAAGAAARGARRSSGDNGRRA
jgi:hypothetical protein